jgi:hypothetical protein
MSPLTDFHTAQYPALTLFEHYHAAYVLFTVRCGIQ